MEVRAVDSLYLPVAVVFMLATLVFRLALQRARTGDTGVRLKAARFTSTWWINMGLLATAVVNLSGLVALMLSRAAPLTVVPFSIRTGAFVLAIAGSAAVLFAQLTMGASWRIGVDESERTALIAHGPYRVVRNPIYSAIAVALIGLTLLAPHATTLTGLAMYAVFISLLVRRVEEPYLLRVHGDAYRAYAATVGRFLPR
jgi:protein-S-isoprenylcysteine O-methyltransferase Ste14